MLSDYLAKRHQTEFIDAANESDVAFRLNMRAAIMTDAGLIDAQWNTIMRHLRDKFHAKIAVSLMEAKRKCYEGYTEPRVKVIYHRAGDKEEEKIVVEYQDI